MKDDHFLLSEKDEDVIKRLSFDDLALSAGTGRSVSADPMGPESGDRVDGQQPTMHDPPTRLANVGAVSRDVRRAQTPPCLVRCQQQRRVC